MRDRRRTRFGRLGVVCVAALVLSACGADTAPDAEQSPLDVLDAPAPADNSTPSVVADDATVASAVEAAAPEVAPAAAQALDQPAIWPAADVVFSTPEEAAAEFVSSVLISEGEPLLGDFQQGDSRSGEIAVLFGGETGDLDPPQELGLLALRQIGPTDGWFVIAATSPGATIDAPDSLAEVPAGTVTVSGEGRGFEGTLVVSAFPPGDASATYDQQIGAGGAFADLAPYSVELDLSGAADGDVVVILVQGDTGLGSDPSTFAAFPVVIASDSAPATTVPVTIPPTR